jgi:hypothetical protein
MPFRCSYKLDQRPDGELVNLYQTSYRFFNSAIGDTHNLPVDADGFPDAVQYYLLYVAALISGAADAALTLTLHNLGREARLLGRQIFEYWVRASYYASNPAEAKALMLSTPFREKEILDELRYDRSLERYKNVETECDYVLKRFPSFVIHVEPSVRRLVGAKNDPTASAIYTFFYRIPSQAGHATGAGFGSVMREEGVVLDSRESNPNIGLFFEAWILQQSLTLLNDYLKLGIETKLVELAEELTAIESRLGENFEAATVACSANQQR